MGHEELRMNEPLLWKRQCVSLTGDVGNDAFEGAAGRRVALLGDAAGLVRQPAGLRGVTHGVGGMFGAASTLVWTTEPPK